MKRISLWLAAAAGALICFQTIPGAPSDSPRMKRILVFGDSLSEGLFLKSSQAYPALLGPKLREAGLVYEILNASQSGGTTAGGLERLPPHLERPVDIFILELGVNDVFRGRSVAEIRENLQTIIDKVRAKNPQVRIVVVGMQVPDQTGEDDYVSQFGQMYADLAAKNSAALVPFLLAGVFGNPERTFQDRLHPNAKGHKVMAETVWKTLEPIAREVANR